MSRPPDRTSLAKKEFGSLLSQNRFAPPTQRFHLRFFQDSWRIREKFHKKAPADSFGSWADFHFVRQFNNFPTNSRNFSLSIFASNYFSRAKFNVMVLGNWKGTKMFIFLEQMTKRILGLAGVSNKIVHLHPNSEENCEILNWDIKTSTPKARATIEKKLSLAPE